MIFQRTSRGFRVGGDDYVSFDRAIEALSRDMAASIRTKRMIRGVLVQGTYIRVSRRAQRRLRKLLSL